MRLIREHYLQLLRPYYETDLIKVITGVRRAGKSILLECIRDELIQRGVHTDHIIFMNLEDLDYEYIQTASDLHVDIKARINDSGKYYIFLDEIQHIEHFEKALASFRASLNVSIFVTGSNSTLLSGDLSTLLTGRAVEFEVLPFSFSETKEYFEGNGFSFTEEFIFEYLKWGVFPLRFEFLGNEESTRRYLTNLYDSIITKDIIKKSRGIDKKAFRDISLYILANAGKEFSAENIANYYNAKNNRKITSRTVYNYLDKMEKSYLLHAVKRYNLVGKSALQGREKFYAIDMGFRTINTNTVNFDDTFFLENIVYNELLFQGFTVFTGKTYKSEVDFVAIREGKKCFIQVSYLMSTQQTIDREFGAFSPITDASPKYVLSLDKLDLSRNGIGHVNLIDWLLHKVDLSLT